MATSRDPSRPIIFLRTALISAVCLLLYIHPMAYIYISPQFETTTKRSRSSAARSRDPSPATPKSQAPDELQELIESSTQPQSTENVSSRKQTRTSQKMPLENIIWVGNQWFLPDGYRVYSPREIRAFFSRHNSVWIGDSTMRRAYLTLHALMMTADPNHPLEVEELESRRVMNVNKVEADGRTNQEETCKNYENGSFAPIDSRSLICRKVSSNDNSSSAFMTYLGEGCLEPTASFLREKANRLFQNYSIIVVSTGLYDAIGRCENRRGSLQTRLEKRRNRIPVIANAFIMALSSFLSSRPANSTMLIYRTSGHHREGESEDNIQSMNQYMLNLTEKRSDIVSVDWGSAVLTRSFGEARIAGDNVYHYGCVFCSCKC